MSENYAKMTGARKKLSKVKHCSHVTITIEQSFMCKKAPVIIIKKNAPKERHVIEY